MCSPAMQMGCVGGTRLQACRGLTDVGGHAILHG